MPLLETNEAIEVGYRSSSKDLEVLRVDSKRCSVAARSVQMRMGRWASWTVTPAMWGQRLWAPYLHPGALYAHLQLIFSIPSVTALAVGLPLRWHAPVLLFGAPLFLLVSFLYLPLLALLFVLPLPHKQVDEPARPRSITCTQQK